MNFLATEGPLAKNPASYIRFIYNRVNLEKAVIRAAAVSALATFAHRVPKLTHSIVLLLKKCLNDSDDEVRERALFYVNLLDASSEFFEKTDETDELKDYMFDATQMLDVDALEAYITANRE